MSGAGGAVATGGLVGVGLVGGSVTVGVAGGGAKLGAGALAIGVDAGDGIAGVGPEPAGGMEGSIVGTGVVGNVCAVVHAARTSTARIAAVRPRSSPVRQGARFILDQTRG